MLPWFQEEKFPLYLAPMAGFTDIGFRMLCREQGADVVVSEFVLADAIVMGDIKVWNLIEFTEEQRPMGIQLFGSEPEVIARAARMIWEKLKPDFIDINYGCPARKVTCKQAGSSLLKDLPMLAGIAAAAVKELEGECPVTAKIRIGWDSDTIVALDAGKALEDAGVQVLAIHGRTKTQGYKGDANWDVIDSVAKALTIPVIGNGSVGGVYDVQAMRQNYAVSGLMVGRVALGNPWLFRELRAACEGTEAPAGPTVEECWEAIVRYADIMKGHYTHLPEKQVVGIMRPRIVKFLRGFSGARAFRNRLGRVESFGAVRELRDECLAENREG